MGSTFPHEDYVSERGDAADQSSMQDKTGRSCASDPEADKEGDAQTRWRDYAG
jgi:hypothetical protein